MIKLNLQFTILWFLSGGSKHLSSTLPLKKKLLLKKNHSSYIKCGQKGLLPLFQYFWLQNTAVYFPFFFGEVFINETEVLLSLP